MIQGSCYQSQLISCLALLWRLLRALARSSGTPVDVPGSVCVPSALDPRSFGTFAALAALLRRVPRGCRSVWATALRRAVQGFGCPEGTRRLQLCEKLCSLRLQLQELCGCCLRGSAGSCPLDRAGCCSGEQRKWQWVPWTFSLVHHKCQAPRHHVQISIGLICLFLSLEWVTEAAECDL